MAPFKGFDRKPEVVSSVPMTNGYHGEEKSTMNGSIKCPFLESIDAPSRRIEPNR
jgi:hypothetical protein